MASTMMVARLRVFAGYAIVPCVLACAANGDRKPETAATTIQRLSAQPWDSIAVAARGTTVVWRMWRGDAAINRFIDEWVAPRLRQRFDITLHAVEGQGAELVNQLVTEREAGTQQGTASLMWINGETFSGMRREKLLAGPWANRLPSAQFVDSASAIVMRDFEQNPDGFESPWGRVQFALIYDTVRTPNPPGSVTELGAWIDAHPGRFTHDESFTGMTFLKSLMYALDGGVERFSGGFDEARYTHGRDALFAWLKKHRGSFWRAGRAYPRDVPALHRMFANGEVDFTMSNNQNEVASKIAQGTLPASSRPLLLRDGTIANAHYLGIPFNAPNVAGAMMVANFLLSPEAQFEKSKSSVWADGTVLAVDRLPAPWAEAFRMQARDARALDPDSLQRYARPEVAPQYHERLQADWRATIRDRP